MLQTKGQMFNLITMSTTEIKHKYTMWIRIILILIITNSSEEKCERKPGGVYPKLYMHTICTNITPTDDLSSQLSPRWTYSSMKYYLFVSNSNIPELTQNIFRNVSFDNITIQANVEIIQDEAFEDLNVTSLILDNNDIKIIKNMCFSSPSIRLLSLQNNSLSKIRVNDFQGLSGLEKLNLKYNSISDIEEDSFNYLTNLEELDLSFNKLVELHFGEFQVTTRLQTIYLNNNLLRSLSDEIFSQCKSLKYLNIANNFITIIDARRYPSSLIFINASNNHLMSANFSNLMNANTITLSFNNLKSVTDSLYNLSSLRYFYLSHNPLGPSLDTNSFHDLKNLTVLDLDNNGLGKIDFVMLNNLPNLQNVSLAGNKLTNLDFYYLNSSLMTLILSKNCLKAIKNLSKLQDLRKLDLSYNNLEEIRYDTLENLTNLTQLWLQYNSIRLFDFGCFRNLNHLRELNLSHNEITDFGIGIFAGLNRLITLDISYNKLSHLNEHIFHSTNSLLTLNISYNYLSEFNVSAVRRQAYIRTISMTGNNWTCKSLIYNYQYHYYLVRGTSYNVTNILGIPCKNTDDNNNNRPPNETGSMQKYFDSVEEYDKQISNKMTIITVFVIALWVLFCVKFTFPKCFPWYAAARQFVYERHRNEQEIQLT